MFYEQVDLGMSAETAQSVEQRPSLWLLQIPFKFRLFRIVMRPSKIDGLMTF
jgi:hypothetical protein